MENKLILVASIIVITLLVFTCAPKSSSGTISTLPTEAVPAQKSITKLAWEIEWEKMVEAARKEGKVVIFNSGTFVGARDPMARVFKEKYGIDIEFTNGGSTEIEERLFRERRVGIYSVDVRISGSTTFHLRAPGADISLPLEPFLILPDVLDPKVWVGGSLPFVDPQKHALVFGAGISPQFLINTNLVKIEEVKSFRYLLDPKWKGKIIMHYPIGPGAGQKAVSVIGSVLLGWDTIQELAKQEPFITRDHYQLVDWVAKGKYAIGAFIQQSRGAEMEEAGAPVKMITIPDASYMSASGCTLGLVNRAPHPNATKLFVNWLLSKEGQTTVYQYMGVPSARLDVPTEGISPVLLFDPAKKYFNSDDRNWSLKQPERDDEINRIFGPLLR